MSKFQEGLQAEAEQDYVQALLKFTAALESVGPQSNADQALTWLKIANNLMRLMKWQQAADTFAFVDQLLPSNAQVHHGLAISYSHLGDIAKALEHAEVATNIAPDDWRMALTHAYILSIVKPDQATKLEIYRCWGERFADPITAKAQSPKVTDSSLSRPLHIGYISGDMREHSIAFFMTPVFANHDKAQVAVSVFSTSKIQDAYTAQLKSLVPDWHDVSALDDDALFKLIRKLKIDVLVDLSGHTEGQRIFVFARRAAPIQVTWLGFMGTLGMQAMDYRLTDFGADPADNEQWYVEKLFRLNCMASYIPPADTPLSPEPPMLENGAPTLISLNNSKKLTDEMLLLWSRILTQRPDATLIIHVQELRTEDAVASMQPRLERLGLPLEQIIISPSVPLAEFMQRGCIADIALDTSPISGGTTTLHALWMGLPVIALDAEDATSSSSARTLQGLGLEQWVAADEDAYIAKVLALMNNPDQLTEHRATTRVNMLSSALMDYPARCAELEQAYRLMWFNYLLTEKNKTAEPRYLDVNVDIAHETIVVESLLTT